MTPDALAQSVAAEATELLAETRALTTALAQHAATSETRHREILEGISECQLRMEKLSEQATQLLTSQQSQQAMENPQLTQLLTQVSETRAEIAGLNRKLSEGLNQTPIPPDSNLSQVTESVTTVTPESQLPPESGQRNEPVDGSESQRRQTRRQYARI